MGVCCTTKPKRPAKSHSQHVNIHYTPDENTPVANQSETLLERNLKEGNTQALKAQINQKQIDVNEYAYDGLSRTILHKALQLSDSPELIQMLITMGADVDAEEKEAGLTPLMIAALDKKYEFIKVLISNSAKIDKKNKKGEDVVVRTKSFYKKKQEIRITDEDKIKFEKVIKLLEDESRLRNNVENLDGDSKGGNKKDMDDSYVRDRY
jgi:hypothetical protein